MSRVVPIAFVLMNTDMGSEGEVLEELKDVEGIEEAHAVYGVYDVIAKIKADSMGDLNEMITSKIRRLNKVRSTLTTIVIEGP